MFHFYREQKKGEREREKKTPSENEWVVLWDYLKIKPPIQLNIQSPSHFYRSKYFTLKRSLETFTLCRSSVFPFSIVDCWTYSTITAYSSSVSMALFFVFLSVNLNMYIWHTERGCANSFQSHVSIFIMLMLTQIHTHTHIYCSRNKFHFSKSCVFDSIRGRFRTMDEYNRKFNWNPSDYNIDARKCHIHLNPQSFMWCRISCLNDVAQTDHVRFGFGTIWFGLVWFDSRLLCSRFLQFLLYSYIHLWIVLQNKCWIQTSKFDDNKLTVSLMRGRMLVNKWLKMPFTDEDDNNLTTNNAEDSRKTTMKLNKWFILWNW